MNTPAIAQRETLRQFYLATTTAEALAVLGAVEPSLLDTTTALHLLCYSAERTQKGQLPGPDAERQAVIEAAAAPLAQALAAAALRPSEVGALLWSVAAHGVRSPWAAALLADVAARELAAPRAAAYSTRDLSSVVVAAGALSDGAPHARAYVEALAAELGARWRARPDVRGAFGGAELADVAQACADVFLGSEEGAGAGEAGGEPAPREWAVPDAVADLLVNVAAEARRGLADRGGAGGAGAFLPHDLARFLAALARFRRAAAAAAAAAGGGAAPAPARALAAEAAAAFDAAAGAVVHRVGARHLNAVSRPDDVAALLGAFAAARHASVAVPELVAAANLALRRGAAAEAERAAAGGAGAGAPARGVPLPALVRILDAHRALGYAPEPATLAVLQPGLRRALPGAAGADVAALLAALAAAGRSPGPAMLGLMHARVEEAAAAEGGGTGGGG